MNRMRRWRDRVMLLLTQSRSTGRPYLEVVLCIEVLGSVVDRSEKVEQSLAARCCSLRRDD